MSDEAQKRHRILVVEDEENIAVALDYLITREGYVHDRVASGADALPALLDVLRRPGVVQLSGRRQCASPCAVLRFGERGS